MISDGNFIDITGIELIPGNGGKDCPGNGEHTDGNGNSGARESNPICPVIKKSPSF